ncbi:hypothetical protein ABGA94_14495, partial [Stenotrophomonas sp. 3diitr2024]
ECAPQPASAPPPRADPPARNPRPPTEDAAQAVDAVPAKAALLAGMPAQYTGPVWTAVLVSSLLVIMGLPRGGIRLFWRVPPSKVDATPDAGQAQANDDAAMLADRDYPLVADADLYA